jgi:hypothetical protein
VNGVQTVLIDTVTNLLVIFHDGTLLDSKLNTQPLITISSSSRILTHGTYPGSVIQLLIATLKTRPTSSAFSTELMITVSNYITHVRTLQVL